jgi:hypothetical protein
MARMRRARAAKKRIQWNTSDWQRAWEMAMLRIDRAPSVVAGQLPFQDAIDMLDIGFTNGDSFQFSLGLITLMDCCREAINQGICPQWW